jgi:hypothetical protein
MRSTTPSVNSSVVAFPPRSGVLTPLRTVARTPSSNRTAASAANSPPCRMPSRSSSIPADRMIAIGLASPVPAMSGADPCAACAIARPSEALMDGAMPSEPASSPARSDRMSPNMFSATTTAVPVLAEAAHEIEEAHHQHGLTTAVSVERHPGDEDRTP